MRRQMSYGVGSEGKEEKNFILCCHMYIQKNMTLSINSCVLLGRMMINNKQNIYSNMTMINTSWVLDIYNMENIKCVFFHE